MSRDRLIILLATGGGLGYAPVASGTFGTLGALPLLPAVAAAGAIPGALLTIALVAGAIRVSDLAEPIFGEKDSGRIVIDEIAGFLVTMLFIPLTLASVGAGFLLFRVFDVLKPWPGSYFDRQVGGGFGVVMDDVVAGVYANLILRALFAFGWLLG